MSIYGRSDMMAVAVPVQQGGCGETHTRPVKDGAPEKVWKLSCPKCEVFLRKVNDPAWSALENKITETPDEIAQREEREKRTQVELEAQNADAFHRLSDAVAGNSEAMNKLVELMALLGDKSAAAPRRRTPKTGA